MPRRLCGSCIGLGILVSALVHGLGLSLLLQRQPPTLEAGAEAGLELELALFAPAGGSLVPVLPSAPDTAPAPPATEAVPLAAPEPAPMPPAEQPPPTRAMPESLISPSVVEDRPAPPPEAKPKSTAPSQTKPKSTAQPKPTPKPKPASKPAEPSPPRPPQPPAVAKRSPRADQVPPDASPGPEAGQVRPAVGATGDEKGTAARGTNTEGAYLAELQRAIIRHQRYPEGARREGRQGSATLSFVLLGDGRFDQVRVAGSSGDRDLDQAAIESLQRLGRFRPIPLEFGRDRWPLSVVIRFNLQ